jgi:hypothetical protein
MNENENKTKYQKTFSHLHASSACVQEVIQMTENKKVKHFIGRKIAFVAMIAALAIGSTVCVNAATNGEFFDRIVTQVTCYINGEEISRDALLVDKGIDENGNEFYTYEIDDLDGTVERFEMVAEAEEELPEASEAE